ncbi:MAG: 2'-deoxycytidine 5'-triphosphate deaminase domain-containing protein, partial [Rhizomicrobium sp.]
MSERGQLPTLFAMAEDGSAGPPQDYSTTGVISYRGLREMMRRSEIVAPVEFEPDQVQPASIDLRLGRKAWRVRASFLPGGDKTVLQRVRQLGGTEIDLSKDAV